MNAPGMHSSGPRPKLHSGSPRISSLPTIAGFAQLRCAVPAGELPAGWQSTPSWWFVVDGVFPLLKTTNRSPLGSTAGSEPWSKLHALGDAFAPKNCANWQNASDWPLISSGVDHVRAWSVDIEP